MAYKPKLQTAAGVPDWTRAPKDAQYYTPETDEEYESFIKIEKGDVYFTNENIGLDGWNRDLITQSDEILTNATGQYVKR